MSHRTEEAFAIMLALITFAWLGWAVGSALSDDPLPRAKTCDAETHYAVFLEDPQEHGWDTPFTCIPQDRVVLP